jgi:hypothetical protein
MLGDAHRQAATDIEQAVTRIGDPAANPAFIRALIELYWGAAFHWIAYGCQQKHGKHKENHTHLAKYLRDLGESSVGKQWEALDQRRAGGWYGSHTSLAEVEEARDLWQDIRTWATS